MFLHRTAFLCVRTCDAVSLVEKFLHGRSVLVNVMLIPTLLKVVVAVTITSVAVAECDVFDIIRSQSTCLWREIVFHILHEKRMRTCYDVNEH